MKLNIAQYNRGGKEETRSEEGMSKRKEEEPSPYAPGGRRAKMQKVSKPAMILVDQKNNQKRNADVNKDTKKRVHINYAMRKIIQRRWNKNLDGGKHESIKQIAESLAIPYTTLRDELKRGCDGGMSCFYLREKNKWQYFEYSADRAEQDACEKGSHKGPQMKITNTFLKAFSPYLEEWKSLPAAHSMFRREHPNEPVPSLRALYNHVTDCMCLNKAFEAVYRAYKKRKPKKDLEIAKNHKSEQTIEKLSPEIKLTKPEGYFQMDLVVSGSQGKGGLITLVAPGHPHLAFIRKLMDLRRKTVHRALRSIMNEAKEKNIKITHILTDNGTEFTDTDKIQKITQAMLFYTHAYASWEKGSIENFNRIIRRFYPKRTDFSRLTPKAIELLQYKLANYPRPTQLKKKAAASRFLTFFRYPPAI
jgi:IS30 family transposase